MEQRRSEVLERWSRALDRGEVPTREAWWNDLCELGAVDLETVERLVSDGLRWPWIPPFELDQVDELARRTIDPAAADLLRRSAEEALEPSCASHLNRGSEPVEPVEPIPDPDSMRTMPGGSRDAEPAAKLTDEKRRMPSGTRDSATSSQGVAYARAAGAGSPNRRRLLLWIGGSSVLTVILVVGALRFSGTDDVVPPEAIRASTGVGDSSGPVPIPPSTPGRREMANAVLELSEALAASREPDLERIFARYVEPILTLDAEAIRQRPEMADAVVALALHRSGGSLLGLAREGSVLAAVSCGWIGGEPDRACATDPPLEAIRDLATWVSSLGTAEAETGEGTP